MRSLSCTLTIFLLLFQGVSSTIISVPSDQPTLQAAIDAAADGDTISVAAGIYTGAGNWDLDPGDKTLLIRSEAGSAMTVIDCGAGIGQTRTAFRIESGQKANLTIDGFSIQSSLDYGIRIDADSVDVTVRNCDFRSFPSDGGGAIFALHASSLTISNCVVDSLPERTYLGDAQIVVENSTFSNNVEDGALKIRHCPSALIRNTTFRNNIAYLGGVADISRSSAVFDSCHFEENVAHSGGGGVLWIVGAQTAINHSTCIANHGFMGGVISAHSEAVVQCSGSIFAKNTADRLAAALDISSATDLLVDHCTFFDNTAPDDTDGPGAQIFLSFGLTDIPSALITNSVIAFAAQGSAAACYDQGPIDISEWITFNCSNVYGNADGDFTGILDTTYHLSDNVSVDPQFVDTANLDLAYQAGSPMLPEFSPCGELIGASGCEPPPGCCNGIRGNINGDALEQIDISDLLFLVKFMFGGGDTPSCTDEADCNGDSSIDVADLTYLVGYSFQNGPAPFSCP